MEFKDPLMAYLFGRDGEHFAVCYFELRGRLIRAADAVLHDRSGAEDVAQDIFMKLLDPGWRPKGLRLGVTFLLGKARKLAEVRLRGEARRRAREHAVAVERLALRPDGNSREDISDLEEAVEALPSPMRLCLKHRRAGLSVQEIVQVTGFSRHKVYQLLEHASERLRRRLGDLSCAFLLPWLAGSPRPPAPLKRREGAMRWLFPWLPAVVSLGVAVVLVVFVLDSTSGPGVDGAGGADPAPFDPIRPGEGPVDAPQAPEPPATPVITVGVRGWRLVKTVAEVRPRKGAKAEAVMGRQPPEGEAPSGGPTDMTPEKR